MSAPGDVLVGRYELQSRLGRGGMAEVFRAHDRRLGREVAVKVLAPHLLADARSVDRFDREARAAASLNHPNIVNVYDAVSDGDTHAIVMELVEGPTLDDMIRREGRLPMQDAVPIAISIADALQAAHDRGLVHHDVKPRNVLFDRDGSVKVTDFGIARAASSDITTVQGSPPYLAPEQARGGRSDLRSDIYALGCVIFEMVAGRPPFEGDSSSAIVMQHIDTPPPRLSDLRPEVPAELDAVVDRALAKDPHDRYDSPAAMRADLTRLASGLPDAGVTIVSTRTTPQDATMALDDEEWDDAPRESTRTLSDEPPRRRMTARTIAIALAAILLLAVLAMAWADSQGRETAAPIASEEPAEPEPEPEPEQPEEPPPDDTDPDGGNDSNRLDRLANRIEDLVQQGREADRATLRRLRELRRDLDNLLERRSEDGGNDTAPSEGSRLDEVRDQIDELVENQDIGEGLANRLRDLIQDVNPFDGG